MPINISDHKGKANSKKKNTQKQQVIRRELYYPALDLVAEAENDVTLKESIASNVAMYAQDALREAGIVQKLLITDEYAEYLRYGAIGELSVMLMPAYYYTDGDTEYTFFTQLDSVDEGTITFLFRLTRRTKDKISYFEDGKWHDETTEGFFGVEKSLLKILQGDSAKARLLFAYTSEYPDEEIKVEQWRQIEKENKEILFMQDNYGAVTDFEILNGKPYLVPQNPFHGGIAIGCAEDGMHLYQYIRADDLIKEDEDGCFIPVDENKPDYHLLDVGKIKNRFQAGRIIEYHFDRDAEDSQIFSIPVDSSTVLHCYESILNNPGRIIKEAKRLKQTEEARINAQKAIDYIYFTRMTIQEIPKPASDNITHFSPKK